MPASGEFYSAASVDARSLLFFPWRIRAFRRHCRELFVWSVNSTCEMRKFIKAGIDGIITDYPDRLKKILDEN
jgi:glycerophosphoryl diester phosphodiesterase